MLRIPFFALFVLLCVGLPEANDQRREGGQDVAAWGSVSSSPGTWGRRRPHRRSWGSARRRRPKASASLAPMCIRPSGPHFMHAYGTCKGNECNSVCDCKGREWRLECGCTDHICQQQCPFIPQQAVSERRRSWRRLRRRMRWGGGIIGAAFTFRRRHCVGDGKGPVKWTPRRRRRQCRALRVNDPRKEVLRPLDCGTTVVPGYLDAMAFEENGCRKDEAMCLRWNRTSRSFWVFGLAKVNNEDARCIGLNTQWAPPANIFTLQWVSTPGRYFLATHQSSQGAGRYVYHSSGNIPDLPWHALNRLHKPHNAPVFRNLTQCCTWMDPAREQHQYCEIDRMCQIPTAVSTSTCQYELCSLGQNDNDPKCKGYTNPAKDNMCKCRDTDQPLQEPR